MSKRAKTGAAAVAAEEAEESGGGAAAAAASAVEPAVPAKDAPKRRPSKGGKRKRKKGDTANFKLSGSIKEDHKKPLFGVQFNPFYGCIAEPRHIFSTVGGNRVSIYECMENGTMEVLQSYVDPEPDEVFYTCAWSYQPSTLQPRLAFAGRQGIIRIIRPTDFNQERVFKGHGQAVNELRFSPQDPTLLLSASADHAMRLWNVETNVCVAIFGGERGHRDEVLSVDFNYDTTKIVSCGMDHSLKIWSLDADAVQDVIARSHQHDSTTKKTFKPVTVHGPIFSTCAVHRNYVDCTRWLGDLVLSKSTDNKIICWKPGGDAHITTNEKRSAYLGDPVTTLHKHEYAGCEIWYVRFSLDSSCSILAVGNQEGKVFVWDLDSKNPSSKSSRQTLEAKYCNSAVRQTSISHGGGIIISVCDDGSVWRWDRR